MSAGSSKEAEEKAASAIGVVNPGTSRATALWQHREVVDPPAPVADMVPHRKVVQEARGTQRASKERKEAARRARKAEEAKVRKVRRGNASGALKAERSQKVDGKRMLAGMKEAMKVARHGQKTRSGKKASGTKTQEGPS